MKSNLDSEFGFNCEKFSFEKYSKILKSGDTLLLVVGSNEFGQLGIGDDFFGAKYPVVQPSSIKRNFQIIACGSLSNIAIDKNGKAYTWGPNDGGVLGRNCENDLSEYLPFPITLPIKYSELKIVKASCGDEHMAVLLSNGQVFSQGCFKNDGRVGHHIDKNGKLVIEQKIPHEMSFPTKFPIIDIASGLNHSVALDSKGQVFIQGVPILGQRSSLRFQLRNLSPKLVASPQLISFKRIFCGSHSVYAIEESGRLYSLGLNNFFQLGNIKRKANGYDKFDTINLPSVEKVESVSSGSHHAMCLTKTGKVYSQGRNASGTLGRFTKRGEVEYKNVIPESVPSADPEICLTNCSKICSGDDHNFALLNNTTDNYSLVGFGFASDYRIGNGSETSCEIGTFSDVLKFSSKWSLQAMSAGSQHSCFLLKYNGDEFPLSKKRLPEINGSDTFKKLKN